MFPGGKGPYCNDTCGSYRYYVKMRSCVPARPNLPAGYSCDSFNGSLTSDLSSTMCEPFVPCKGDLNAILKGNL